MAGLFVVLGIIATISIVWVVRMKRAILKIWSMTPLERYRKLNVLLERYGFYYEAEQDVFLNRSDYVKRDRGIKGKKRRKNSITVSFVYRQKKYLLYISWEQKAIFLKMKLQLLEEGGCSRYYPVRDRRCTDMAFALYEKGRRSMLIRKKGWQLLVKKPYCIYEPECMKLHMHIIFPDSNMALAFAKGMREAGWRFVVLSKNCTGVMIDVTSMTEGAKNSSCFWANVHQQMYKGFLYCYSGITKPFYKTLDRMLFFHEMLPFLFPILFCGEKSWGVSKKRNFL